MRERYVLCGEQCFYCLTPKEFRLITIDHFFPRSLQNSGTGNRVFACRECNNMKQSLNVYEFRERMCKEATKYMKRDTIRKLPNHIKNLRLEYYKRLIVNCNKILKMNPSEFCF
jgi:5-methylcytosine-specific restriction endonuclease McrA